MIVLLATIDQIIDQQLLPEYQWLVMVNDAPSAVRYIYLIGGRAAMLHFSNSMHIFSRDTVLANSAEWFK